MDEKLYSASIAFDRYGKTWIEANYAYATSQDAAQSVLYAEYSVLPGVTNVKIALREIIQPK